MTNDKIIYGETFWLQFFHEAAIQGPGIYEHLPGLSGAFFKISFQLSGSRRMAKKSTLPKINTKDDSSCAGKITCNFQNRSISSEDKNDARVCAKSL